MNFHIRPATLDDLDLLMEFRDLSVHERHPDADMANAVTTESRGWIADHMRDGTFLAYFAVTEAGEIAATAGLWLVDWLPGMSSTTRMRGYIFNVYTRMPFRRMGLATLLTEHCLAVCRERGVQVVALNASELGRAVYEKLGFESSGTEMRLSL